MSGESPPADSDSVFSWPPHMVEGTKELCGLFHKRKGPHPPDLITS